MLVFILNREPHELALRLTEQSLRHSFADARTVAVNSDYAQTINETIKTSPEPFFLILYAGERIAPCFREELRSWLERLPADTAGIALKPAGSESDDSPSVPRGPVVWRKEAVLAGANPGFLPARRLPFPSYMLLEMQFRLSPDWQWQDVRTDAWMPGTNRIPKWRNTQEEWAALRPVLAAKPAAAGLGGQPRFSVAICTYNNAEYLEWAIRSVLVQTLPDWELLIVDDGSQDDTRDLLSQYRGDPRFTVLRNEENRGKSFCLNLSLAKAGGSWLVELDADDWLTSDALAVFANAMNREPAGAYYANHYEWVERDGQEPVFRKKKTALSPFAPDLLLETASPLAPRCYDVRALRELGGWWEEDPFDGRLYEDFQMLLRMSRRYAVRHVNDVLYHRRLRKGSVTRSNPACYEGWKDWIRRRMGR